MLIQINTNVELFNLSCEQTQISEAMDIRTRQGLLNALVGKMGKRMDTLLIPLELLCCISRSEFSDKKSYIRWQKRQVSSLSLRASFFICLFNFFFFVCGWKVFAYLFAKVG